MVARPSQGKFETGVHREFDFLLDSHIMAVVDHNRLQREVL